jgi:hypothetical protein
MFIAWACMQVLVSWSGHKDLSIINVSEAKKGSTPIIWEVGCYEFPALPKMVFKKDLVAGMPWVAKLRAELPAALPALPAPPVQLALPAPPPAAAAAGMYFYG